MKIFSEEQAPQGSAIWHKLRLGIPTASMFSKIITPKTGKLSASADEYAYQLIAEKLLQRPAQDLSGLEHIERGNELEAKAIKAYEFEKEVIVQRVGFITNDEGTIGCSPDALVGDEGLAEFKCPTEHVHIRYIIEGIDEKYRPQYQGQLWLSERRWNDLYSYNPLFNRVICRIERDEAYINLMRSAVKEFNLMKDEFEQKVLAQGYFEQPKPVYDIAEKELQPDREFIGSTNYVN